MHKEPVVDKIVGTDAEASAFLRTMAATVAVCLVMIIAAGIWSNHFGDFGDTGRFMSYNDRLAKSEFLISQEPKELAKVWILGSSVVLPILPPSVAKRFNSLKTFNLGVFWGSADDTWAWLNFLLSDLHTQPEMLIIGVETWTFAEPGTGPLFFRDYRRRLLNAPLLSQHLGDYGSAKHWLSRIIDLTTTQSLKETFNSLRSWESRSQRKPIEDSKFLIDGSNKIYNELTGEEFLPGEVNQFYQKIINGQLDAESASVQAQRDRYIDEKFFPESAVWGFLPGDKVSSKKMDLFRQVVEMCNEKQIPVAIIMLPVHPHFYDHLVRLTRHEEHLAEVKSFLLDLQKEYPFVRVVLDASRIEYFDGSPFAFHDKLHMTPENTEKILDKLQGEWGTTE